MKLKNSSFKNFCIILTAMLLSASSLKAQDIYGENPEKCKQKLSIMTTYYKQKAYANAAPSWRYLVKNCPQASKNTYIIGSKIMEMYANEAATPELKSMYVDSLLMNQDLRMKYFPDDNPSKQLAKKAIYLLKYRLKKDYKTAFHLLDSAFNKGSNELSAYDFKMYMYCYNLMTKSKARECDQMLETYIAITSIITKREQRGSKVKEKTKQQITAYAEICMNCDLLDSLYSSNFDVRKNDTTWLDDGILLFKSKKCNSSLTFLLLLETRYLSKPSASIASTLGKYYMNIQNDEKAKNYFDDAITLEKDSLKIATHHINKSKYLLANKKYNASFYEAKKAIKQDPNNATAYLIAGNAIAYSSSFCTELSFGGKELYWLAVDYYNQATKSAINEKERLSASEKIKKFQQYFPEKGDVFLKSLTEGSVYKVGCSFNENTRVRSLN